jgi:acyl carrier protein
MTVAPCVPEFASRGSGESKSMDPAKVQDNGNIVPDELARAVQDIVAQKVQRPVDEVPLDADLESELGIDSLVMIEINVLLEEQFGVVMPEVGAPGELRVRTVRDLAAFVADRRR